jgi:hypothetical protein
MRHKSLSLHSNTAPSLEGFAVLWEGGGVIYMGSNLAVGLLCVPTSVHARNLLDQGTERLRPPNVETTLRQSGCHQRSRCVLNRVCKKSGKNLRVLNSFPPTSSSAFKHLNSLPPPTSNFVKYFCQFIRLPFI